MRTTTPSAASSCVEISAVAVSSFALAWAKMTETEDERSAIFVRWRFTTVAKLLLMLAMLLAIN